MSEHGQARSAEDRAGQELAANQASSSVEVYDGMTSHPIHTLISVGEELTPCPDCVRWSAIVVELDACGVTLCEWHEPDCPLLSDSGRL